VSDTSFGEGKREVARLVDTTYDAVLRDFEPRRFPGPAVPCRSAGGAGPATGEYLPAGSLVFDVPPREESKRYVAKVRDYWREQGFENVEVDPVGEIVNAQKGSYRLTFNLTPRVGKATLGASGPCAKPDGEDDREEPPQFRSLGDSAR